MIETKGCAEQDESAPDVLRGASGRGPASLLAWFNLRLPPDASEPGTFGSGSHADKGKPGSGRIARSERALTRQYNAELVGWDGLFERRDSPIRDRMEHFRCSRNRLLILLPQGVCCPECQEVRDLWKILLIVR